MIEIVKPKTNSRIAGILRKLTPVEREKLETQLLRDGIQDPIVIWEETGELLDGHNRVDIGFGNNQDGLVLEFKEPEYVSLQDEDAAIEYVLERQEGQRNVTPQDLSYSRGKLYERRKQTHGTNQHTRKRQTDASSSDTAESVGGETGVSDRTSERDAEYSRAVDALTKAFGKDFEAHVRSGESKLSKADVVMLAEELGKDDSLLYSAAELWAFGYTGTFKLAHLLTRCHRECGPKTHAALWEHSDSTAKVRESPPQLAHLLKLASTGNEDEVTADLVTLAESGHVRDVFKAHDQRQKERQKAEQPSTSDAEEAAKKWGSLINSANKLASGIRTAGGASAISKHWPEQNRRVVAESSRELAEQFLEFANELERGGENNGEY